MSQDKLPVLCNSFEMVQDLGLEFDIESATAEEYPDFSPCSKISRLGNITTPELLPDFSGTIRYRKEFSWDAQQDHKRYFIDSGEVYEVAELFLNDQKIGCAITPPYRFEITSYLKSGINRLQIDVTNTLGKARGDNRFDRCVAHEPSGLIGPVQIWRMPLNTSSDN